MYLDTRLSPETAGCPEGPFAELPSVAAEITNGLVP